MFEISKFISARFLFRRTTLASAFGILLLLAHPAQAQLPPPTAQDTASDSAYDPPPPGWNNGDNGGFGMGPWTLNPALNTPQNGFFVDYSTGNNGMSGDTNGDGDINTPVNRAWGLYANSGQTASAVRNFLAPFTPGSVFEIFMDNGYVQIGGTVGFALQNSSGQDLLEVYFAGGDTEYTVRGNTPISSGVSFTREGVRVVITLTTASTYQATLTRLVDGAGNTVSGNLRNNPGPISQLRLFNADAGTSPDNDVFFNRITYYRGRVLNTDTGRGYLNIQPAIDDPATLAGHTINVAADVYTGTVIARKPVAIVGAGPGQTIIRSLSPGIVVTTSNVTISNTSIVGTGSDVGITTTFGVTNLTVSNVHISNFAQGVALLGGHSHTVQNSVFTLTNVITSVGVGMTGLTTTLPITNVLVSGNVFTGSGYAVVGLFANQNAIVGNQMRYGTAGVRLAGANGNLIEGNQIENNSSYAIYLAPNAPPLIPSPVLSNSNNVISGNVALNHPNDRAIQIINSPQPGNGNQIVNNVIQNAGQAGILTGLGSGDTNLLIAGNTVITANPGIVVSSSVTATITNNQVSGGSIGIQVANSSKVVVISNTTSNNGDGILVDSNSSHVTVTNNAASSAGNGFRITNSSAVTVTANQATNSTTGFFVDNGSNAVALFNNQAQSLNTGVRVGSGATNVTLASNTVDGTALSLELQNSSHVVITGNTLINSGLGFSITNGAGNLVTATFNVITSTGGVLFNSGGNASGLLLRRNNLANNTGITNTAAGTLNAECNWYGAVSGPSGVGNGSGTPVSTGVDFNPWLLSDDLNGPCSGGSLTIQKVLVGPITPTTAWQFTATVPTGTLVFTLPAGGGAVTFSGLDFGQVSITETTKLGYIPTSSCTTGATGGASISFNLIGNVTCTFTNTITPATTVITVTPVITNGWFYITETVGPGAGLLPFDIVLSPPDPTLGKASARLVITDVNWRHMYLSPIFTGTLLSDITVFEYRLRIPSASPQLPYINIGWDDDVTDGDTGFRGRLVYTPPPSLASNTWHIIDARNDPTPNWYTTITATQCTASTPCTFAQLVAAYPNAAIHPNTLMGVPLGFVGIRVGGGSSTGTGYADGLRVGVGSQITLFDFEAAPPTTVTLAASPTTTVVGNNVLLTATVTIANGDPAADGTVVSFTSSLGNVSPVTATTIGGVATATLSSTVAGVAAVTATVNSLSATAQVTFTPGAPFTLTLTAVPATLPVGNSSTLTATATDQYGNPVADGTTISFTTSLGALSSSTANTSGGDASVTLSSTVASVATVTATVNSLSATAQVTFTPGAPFTLTLTAVPATLPVGNSSTLTATATDQFGNPVADGTTISFTTSLGGVSPVTATTVGGVVTATLNSTVAGVAAVTATVNSLSATAQVTFTPGAPFTLTLTAVPATLPVGNSSTLTATATDQYGNPVADGTTISFTTSLGALSSSTANTSGGDASVTLSSTVASVATVTATVNSLSATAQVTFTPGAPFTLTLTAVPATLPVGNSSTLTATATDQFGNPVADGTTISFTTSLGGVSPVTATTVGGVVTATLNSTVAGVAAVTATVNSLSATAQVTFTPGAPFTLRLTAAPATLPVGNSSTLTATATDQFGNPVADGTTISFTTSLGTLSSGAATTSSGSATVTLSSIVAGVATVTATVNSLSATAQVTFTPGAPFTLRLTAAPATLPVGNSSTLTATATDQFGNPVADGTTISFTTSLGTLSSATATTSGGNASVTLNSTLPGVATVTATVGSLNATTLVTFTAGAPFTLMLTAVPATLPVGNSSTLTATATDQFGNPVADGTTISFTTSLGSISPVTATTVGGVATATLSSTVAGIATVTATVNSLSATTQVTFTAGAPFTLTLTAVPATLPVGNSSTLTATATDQFGNPVADGTTISFTTSLGTLSSGAATTSSGSATVTLSSIVAGVATVTATVNSLSATAQVTFTAGAPFTFTFTLTPTVIVANGISQSLGTATVVDQYGNPVGGVTVNFLAGIGSFSPASGATNAGGQVTATLTSLTPAIENVFAAISGLGFRSAQATYVNPPASSAPLTSTLQTVTQTLGVVRKGGLITYTLTVTNTGAGQINNVLLFAPIPSGTTYVAGSASGGNFGGSFAMLLTGQELGEGPFGPQAALNAVTWSGNLPSGASHTLSYVVQVQILEGQVVNQPKVFVDNADTGINLSSAVDVVAYKIYVPIVRRQ
jgi:parallel beta-helix repeat protein